MASGIIATAQTYMNEAILEPYRKAATSILCNPSLFKFDEFGEKTYVREVSGGNAANYRGKFEKGGKGEQTVWTGFTPRFDRQKSFYVDAREEYNSILQGMELSGVLLNRQFWNNFGGEVDAVVLSTLFANTKNENKIANSVLRTDTENIFATLNTLKNKMFNAGATGPYVVFVNSDVYTNISNAIINKNGLANPHVLSVYPSLDDQLEVKIEVLKYNGMFVVNVPTERMVSHITLLDGFSGGQEEGGWKANTDEGTFKKLDIVALPLAASALSVRHLVTNLVVPVSYLGMSLAKAEVELEGLNDIYQNFAKVKNIGINQSGDEFGYLNRIIYDAVVFEKWKKTLFVVHQ